MCVIIFSPANSIKYIYHSNKYLVRCLRKACSNMGRSVWKPSIIIILFWPNWNVWKNVSETLHDQVSCFSSCYMWTDMEGLTEMETKEAHIYTFFIATLPNKFTILHAYCFYPVHLIYCCHIEFVVDTQMCPRIGSSITGIAPSVHSYTRNLSEENFTCHWKGNR